jgi:hypothetical protein
VRKLLIGMPWFIPMESSGQDDLLAASNAGRASLDP